MSSRTFNDIPVDRYGIPIPTPEAELEEKKPTSSSEEILWSEYSIRPNLPIRAKIEQLITLWRLAPEKIASLLGLSVDLVKEEISALTREWQELGKSPTDENKEIIRGRMIAELLRLKAEVESGGAGTNDSRFLTLKLQIIEKLTKLQGVDVDKKELVIDEVSLNPVHVALESLTTEQKEALYEKLKSS